MTSTDVDVLITGAGPTGLTLACDLARRGVQFRIVDKERLWFIGSKGKGLQPRRDRAPDAPGLNESGEPVRLFDLFRGPQFTLLRLFGPETRMSGSELRGVRRVDVKMSPRADDGAQVYVDAFGHAAAAFGGKGEYMLVRPDGYVGWIGCEGSLTDLGQYLAAVSAEYRRFGIPTSRTSVLIQAGEGFTFGRQAL